MDMQENVKVMMDKVAVLRKVVGKYMMRNFKDMPLTGDQSRLLFVIKEHGHSQKEVAQCLHVSDATLSVRIKRLEEAINHIYTYSTKHSESIITENDETAALFMKSLDSACVYHNASTRFSDGGEFGFGAELGISTQKLHARGPLGLKEMCSYQYKIEGNGQIRE